MAGTILELDQLTAESEQAIENMEARPHGVDADPGVRWPDRHR